MWLEVVQADGLPPLSTQLVCSRSCLRLGSKLYLWVPCSGQKAWVLLNVKQRGWEAGREFLDALNYFSVDTHRN